jgi:aryl-alcohol dehydrogenase-like predicted oxidoreductase
VDYVDLYWLHRDDPNRPVEEIFLMLEDFRRAGKIRYAGLSNWTQPRAEAARLAAEELNVPGFIGIQNQWSLAGADRSKGDPTSAYIDESFIKRHTKHGFAAFAYSPQANGYFRRLEKGTIDQASDLVKGLFHHATNQRRYERIKELQQQTGYSQGQIVLGYLLSRPFPVFPNYRAKQNRRLRGFIRGGRYNAHVRTVEISHCGVSIANGLNAELGILD